MLKDLHGKQLMIRSQPWKKQTDLDPTKKTEKGPSKMLTLDEFTSHKHCVRSAMAPHIDHFFENVTSEQWTLLLSGQPDSLTVKQLVDLLYSMMDLCSEPKDTLKSAQEIPTDQCPFDSASRGDTAKTQSRIRGVCGFLPVLSAIPEEDSDDLPGDLFWMHQLIEDDILKAVCKTDCPSQQTDGTQAVDADTQETASGEGEEKESCLNENSREKKVLVGTLIQAVLSHLAKASKSCPSDSLHKNLLEKLWAEIEGTDLPLSPERLKNVDMVIFQDLCDQLTVSGDDLLALMNLEDPETQVSTTSIFKKHLLALIDIYQCELYEKEEQHRFSVEICVEELVRHVVKKSGRVITEEKVNAIYSRLTSKVWAEIKDEYVNVPLENFKNLSKVVYKSLCKMWKNAETILMFMELEHQKPDEEIVKIFKKEVVKLSKNASTVKHFFSSIGQFFWGTSKKNKVSPLYGYHQMDYSLASNFEAHSLNKPNDCTSD